MLLPVTEKYGTLRKHFTASARVVSPTNKYKTYRCNITGSIGPLFII